MMPIEEAKKPGAMMLFGEKYGDEVRVLDIGDFARAVRRHARRAHRRHRHSSRSYSEGGVAAGIRRIEAVTGPRRARVTCRQQEAKSATRAAGSRSRRRPRRSRSAHRAACRRARRRWRRSSRGCKAKARHRRRATISRAGRRREGHRRCSRRSLDGADAKALRETMDKLKDKLKSAAIVLGRRRPTARSR